MAFLRTTPAFLLHKYSQLERKVLLVWLGPECGKARGMFRLKKGCNIELFSPFLLSFQGDSSLKKVRTLEPTLGSRLSKKRLFEGAYLNELLMRLLPEGLPCFKLFEAYGHWLQGKGEPVFLKTWVEWALLEELGTLPSLQRDAQGNRIQPDFFYKLHADGGFFREDEGFSGESLLLLLEEKGFEGEALKIREELCQKVIQRQLEKPLLSSSLLKL